MKTNKYTKEQCIYYDCVFGFVSHYQSHSSYQIYPDFLKNLNRVTKQRNENVNKACSFFFRFSASLVTDVYKNVIGRR